MRVFAIPGGLLDTDPPAGQVGDWEYCEKLDRDGYMLYTDSQDIEAALRHIGYRYDDDETVTGVVVRTELDEFAEVWVTGWRAPYAHYARYVRVL